jgi:hypothetical protein
MLAAYLAITIMGIFTFAAVEPLRSIDFGENRLILGDPFNQADRNTIDCPTEAIPVVSMAIGYSFSPLRIGPLRILLFLETQNVGFVLFQSFFKTLKKINYRTEKKSILLKLRI